MKKIDEKLEKNYECSVENREDNTVEETATNRRSFLKKAAYSAPVLLVLGQLAKPTKAQADSGNPDGPPNWGGF